MTRSLSIALFGGFLLFGGACGDEPNFGARCATSAECDDGYCCRGARCPGGFCTSACETDAECRTDSACVTLSRDERLCLIACTATEDCTLGTGMECVEIEERRVCANE